MSDTKRVSPTFAKDAQGIVEIPRKKSKSAKLVYRKSGVKFGQDPNNSTYVKVHIGISRPEFKTHEAEGLYRPLDNGFSIQEITGTPETMADKFLGFLTRAGGAYGWNARAKYQKRYRDALLTNMDDPETRLFCLYDHDEPVAFLKTSGIKKDWKRRGWEQGLNKYDAINMFAQSEPRLEDFPRPIEIDKLGVFPEYTGRGYGQVIISHVLRLCLLENDYNIVYLDTRNSNPTGVEEFYLKLALRSFAWETLKGDHTRRVPYPPELPEPAPIIKENKLDA